MRIFLFLFFSLLSFTMYAQEDLEQIRTKAKELGFTIESPNAETSDISFIKVFNTKEEQSAGDLYKKIEAYFTYAYGKGDFVIQVKNENDKYIIAKGIYANFDMEGFSGWQAYFLSYSAPHIIRIDCKDSKIRAIITIPKYIVTRESGNQITGKYSRAINPQTYPINPNIKLQNLKKKSIEYDNYLCFKGVVKEVEDHFSQIEEMINKGNTTLENQDW